MIWYSKSRKAERLVGEEPSPEAREVERVAGEATATEAAASHDHRPGDAADGSKSSGAEATRPIP
jgi:hypothetical protein